MLEIIFIFLVLHRKNIQYTVKYGVKLDLFKVFHHTNWIKNISVFQTL
jgi:hypothetical protein